MLWVHLQDSGEMGCNTGCARGQLVLFVFAGQQAPPDSGRSDDSKNIISTPHKVFTPERVRDKDLLENGVLAHNCTRKRGL